ncbi:MULTISPECIES: sensor histidine kinase [Caloramator]|uniref:histidine kinase n=1 Tax=Caloramator proteoclasticus DSM 10124 TaxID=1121262 RepID=A0A1M4YKW6_9CLOT|nr:MULTISPECIES: HAMP domain-containing sensor histidine kinase [Caloramator]SHF06495.1 Signal transduction histidine kinase [Caloramator proteoclasticus DSM 10124]
MKKSLFTKLISAYLVILLISYSLVAVFLSYWFYKYYYNQKTNSLINQGYIINKTINDYLTRKISKDKMITQIRLMDEMSNTRILIVDKYGFIYAYSSNEMKDFMGKQITDNEIQEVLSGNVVIKSGGFKQIFSKPMLMVGMPIVVADQVQSAVFLHSPLYEVKNTLKTVYFVIWMAAFFAMFISAIIIYYFSEKILIRPLNKINSTAKSIAKGEFDKRVDLESDDEIGDLAHSFNYMADSLQSLEDMRRSFIANISHELRSPMTSINGFITGIIDGTIPKEKWIYYLNIVHDEIKRLMRLINDILDLARLESGEFSINIGVFDLNELIRQRVIKFEDKINKRGIEVNVKLIEKKLKVKGDRDRIDQVLTNLIDNAIKFVPDNGLIEIKTEIKERKVIVHIYNNGPAIPKEEIKYIWDRFHKVDKARSKGGGTGLGLSIVRQIINQHGETIWVESGDFGTRFSFTLSLV